MSLARRQAVVSVVTWTLVLTALVAAFLKVGAGQFCAPEQSLTRLAMAVIFLPGFIITMVIVVRARNRRHRGELDERDEAVARRASEATLIVVVVLVYASAMALYTVHMKSGYVPAGWLYLLAYGTAGLVPLTHAAATLILDLRGGVDA